MARGPFGAIARALAERARRHRARISELFPILREERNSVLGPQPCRTAPDRRFDAPCDRG